MSELEPVINRPEYITVPTEIQLPVEPQSEQKVHEYYGQVRAIPEGEFKGDPSRVLGHPSNPWSGHIHKQD